MGKRLIILISYNTLNDKCYFQDYFSKTLLTNTQGEEWKTSGFPPLGFCPKTPT